MRLIPSVPRVPGVPDPLRRSRIPAELEAVTTVAAEVDAREAGMDPENVERVWRAVERLYRSGVHPAIALCVRRQGHVVLDRAIGHARGNGPRDGREAKRVLATPETPFMLYSASKAITAMVAHHLDQRGLIHVGDRVAEYLPEYGRNGKHGITIEHVLSHRAGVPQLPVGSMDPEMVGDPEQVVELMCEQRPSTRPGKALAYHAVSGGYLIAEIVRRVTGSDIREYLAQELRRPLGFRWLDYGVAEEDLQRLAVNYPTGAPVMPPFSTLLTRALGLPVDEITEASNNRHFLTGIIPAGNSVATANELSRFYELLRCGGELDGVRVFEPRTIRRALVEQSYMEIDLTLGFPTRYSLGFMLGTEHVNLYGPGTKQAFGHLGFTNLIGWADPERAISVGLLTSGKPVLYPQLPDLFKLTAGIARAAPKVPLKDTQLWTSGQ